MPRSDASIFQSPKTGLFYFVNIKGEGGVHGGYDSEQEAKEARRRLPEHLRSCRTVDARLRPQPAAEGDINPLTR